MSKKKYTAKEAKEILFDVLANALHHMYELEKQVEKLNIKMDDTDSEESLKSARIYTMVLTILNDVIHPAHFYATHLFDSRIMDRYIKNQKIAFDKKLVSPCSCSDCKKRGYANGNTMAMGQHTSDSEKRDEVTQ